MTPGVIVMDLHGKTVFQAQTAIQAQLRRVKAGTYRIWLIHGYHCGTALREMIQTVYGKHPQIIRLESAGHDGYNDLVLREF